MAGLTWLCFARYGQRSSGHADLDHHVYYNYLAHGAICSVLDQLDVHDELHYTVGTDPKVTRFTKEADWT